MVLEMYMLIKGTYYVVGMSPDADSIKFKADNPNLWQKIETENRKQFEEALTKEAGIVTIRLQAIDALETHYTPPSVLTPKDLATKAKGAKAPGKGNHRQPHHLGEVATDTFLAFMGVTEVKWKSWGRNTWIDEARISGTLVKDKLGDAIPGYIITDDVERNGRPLGWVFAGNPPFADGTPLTKHQVGELVSASANAHLLQRGTVYPFFYMSLPGAIRIPLMEAARQAQQNPDQEDVWLHDHTDQGVDVASLTSLYDNTVVYPYLFRRIVRQWYGKTMNRFWDSLRDQHDALPDGEDLGLDLDGFFEDGDPWIFVISQQDFLHLSDILDVTRTSLKLHVYPYDIVFLS
ncbi:MAG: hypothetical protein H6672_05820 [Anaerolineaceae bacterium]|nr:hypothetical protein [Anaerolineaceae bacterium]